jgi:PAS domain S-box-containing protein
MAKKAKTFKPTSAGIGSGETAPCPAHAENRSNKGNTSRTRTDGKTEMNEPSACSSGQDRPDAIFKGKLNPPHSATPNEDQSLLKGAERRYRLFVEEMNEGAATLNAEGAILYANSALTAMLGLPPEKVLGSSFSDYLASGSSPGFSTFMKLASKSSSRTEAAVRTSKGSIVPVLLSGRTMSHEAGVRRINLIVTDLTLQKQAEDLLRRGSDELEIQVSRRTEELRSHQIELEMQNEELRTAQEELESSRSKYAELYEFAPIGYFMIDSHGLIQDVNFTGVKLLGTDKRLLVNKPFSLFVDGAADRDLLSAHRKEAFLKQVRVSCELRMKRANGSVFYAELQSVAVENADGKAGFIRTAVTDITLRRWAEDALRESEARYRSLIELSPDAVIVHAEGKFLYLNPAALALYGAVDAGKIIGHPVLEFVHPDDRESIRQRMQGAYDQRAKAPLRQTQILRLDGRAVDVEATAAPITYQGKTAVLVVIRDVSERKRAEAKYSTILATVQSGFWLLDLEGRLLEVNGAYCRMSGYSRDELFQMHIKDLETVESADDVRDHMQFIRTRGHHQFESRHRRKDGRIFDVDIRASYLDFEEGRFVVFLWDTTERKRAEKRIYRQNSILDGMNRIFLTALENKTDEELGRACLEVAEHMTQSLFSFIGEIGPDGLLENIAISNRGRELCTMRDKAGHDRIPADFKIHGLYGSVLIHGKSFFTNDPSSHPDSIGLPEGHPQLTAFLGIPLQHDGRTTGMVGLGKREGGYHDEDVEAMEGLAQAIVQVFLRKRAMAALRESEERFRAMADGTPLMIWVTDSDMRIQFVNSAYCTFFGMTLSTVQETGWQPLVHPDDADQYVEAFLSAVRFRKPFHAQARVMVPDGTWRWIESYGEPRFSGPGEFLGFAGSSLDITGRKQAEEKLRMLNEELELRVQKRTDDLARTVTRLQKEIEERKLTEDALLQTQLNLGKAQSIAHIGSWSFDLRTDEIAWSEELFRIFGLEQGAEAVPKSIIPNAIHPDDWVKVQKAYQQMLTVSKTDPLEFRIILPDRENRIVWAEAETLFDESGRPISIVGTVQDITERKQAEEELTRLVTAVQSAADALIVTDAGTGIIQYVNPAFEKMTGYSREEIIGRDVHLLDSGRHDESFYQNLRQTLKSHGFWSGRLVQKRKDGTLYEEECTYSPVKNAAGEIISYIAIKRDVTEKLRLESIAQAVETMNNIGYIFSGVSHEIGNPINSIRMTLDLMKRELSDAPIEKLSEFLSRGISQVQRVEYLLKSLKNFNLYENLQPQKLDVPSFLETFLSMVNRDFEAKGIQIDVSGGTKTACIFADPRALQQVLLNILTNSSDALEGRQAPKINLEVSAGTAGMVAIKVSDNGCGMDERRLKDLFKPFYTTKKQGTGLGLVIIKKMVTRMNGTVEITSRLNEGTLVEISLPSDSNGQC